MPGGSRLGSEDVAAAFDALNEQQPGWAALQRVLQQARGAGGDGAAAGAQLHVHSVHRVYAQCVAVYWQYGSMQSVWQCAPCTT